MSLAMSTRTLLTALCAVASLGAAAQAPEAWPAKPVHVIVPFPPGGPTDIAARAVSQALADALGVPFIVDNRVGERGFLGIAEAARAPADGYTLMVGTVGTMAITPRMYDTLPYDAEKDFAPVSLLVTVPIVVVANPDALPVADLGGLVAHLRAHPGQVRYGSSGRGGSNHLVPEDFQARTGTRMTQASHLGAAAAIDDLLAGRVQLMFDTLLTSAPLVASGRLRMLAVATAHRLPSHPEVPTVAEALGLADFDASSWFALYAPAGTPAAIVERLSAEVALALRRPAVAAPLQALGAVPVGSSPQVLAAFQRAEQARWGEVITRAKLRVDDDD